MNLKQEQQQQKNPLFKAIPMIKKKKKTFMIQRKDLKIYRTTVNFRKV